LGVRLSSRSNNNSKKRGGSSAAPKRKGGVFTATDEKYLKKIHVDEKKILERLKKHKSAAARESGEEVDAHLRDFWAHTKMSFELYFGKYQE
jgi:hypothetical protein